MSENHPRAVVTAATDGIGLETAAGLARRGYAVTVVGRDPDRGAAAVERIGREGPAARFLAADLSSLEAVRGLGARLAAEGPLKVLVNNVGGMFVRRWESVDGIEGAFVLNHLSPLLLTEALLDALKAGGPSRIVSVTSMAVMAAVPEYDKVDLPGPYYGLAVAGRAKIAHLAYVLDLAERLRGSGISVLAADPGPAATPNAAAMEPEMLPPALRPHWDAIREGVRRPVADAAASVLLAAADPSFEGRTGVVVGQDGTSGDALRAYLTPEAAAAARALTARVLGGRGGW